MKGRKVNPLSENTPERGVAQGSPQGLQDSLHPLEIKALKAAVTLPEGGITDSALAASGGMDEAHARTSLQWLLARGLIAESERSETTAVSLNDHGARCAKIGLPETRILDALEAGKPVTVAGLSSDEAYREDDVGAAFGALKNCGAVDIGAGGVLVLKDRSAAGRFESVQALLLKLAGSGSGEVPIESLAPEERELVVAYSRKRGKGKGLFRAVERASVKYRLTDAGRVLASEIGEVGDAREISQITPEMLADGSWRDRRVRGYNIGLKPPRPMLGKRHPYMTFLDFVRDKFLALGFEEMRGPLVENEFWNMDALFMPQFHSARDIHDVYYVKRPSQGDAAAEPFASQVARTHEDGWRTGSKGWGYKFDPERARRLVLRSQGTSLSARTLAGGPNIPGKYFAIARCFRYEQVDATHLSDFYQIEGIVLGEEINFRHLLGLLKLFADEVAHAKEIKFTPAYFPFTEPSVELHVNHPKLGWMELGGAGLFRPEVNLPLGVEVPVIAWGLGIDRMAMSALGISDIRHLFAPDLDFMRTQGKWKW
jgi:phenylalanyl-tRNA synthetase alpha chain